VNLATKLRFASYARQADAHRLTPVRSSGPTGQAQTFPLRTLLTFLLIGACGKKGRYNLAIRLTGKNLPISTARIKKFCTTTHHKADKILREGFRPRFTIEEGLHKMVKWYISLR